MQISPAMVARPTPLKGMPMDVRFHRHPIGNRLFVESFGFYLWSILLSRNNYERIEKAADLGCWVVIALAIPLLLGLVFNRIVTPRLMSRFGFKLKTPLELSFKWLDKNTLSDPKKRRALVRLLGLPKDREKDLDTLAQAILNRKLLIMLMDLYLMASKGQIYFWGKNILTEKLSGEKGFAGELHNTSQAFRSEKTKAHEAQKKKKLWLSLAIGFGGATALPLALKLLMRYNAAPIVKSFAQASGFWQKLKSLIPHFNYTDAIKMSKWVMLYHCLFNWNIPGLLSARDNHERREHLTRSVIFDFFYGIGDDIFAGLAGLALTRWYHKKKQDLPAPVMRWKQSIFFGKVPRVIPLEKIFLNHQNRPSYARMMLTARWAAWIGLLGTALCMGIGTTLANNAFTKRKVEQEQAAFNRSQPQQTIQPVMTPTRVVPRWSLHAYQNIVWQSGFI